MADCRIGVASLDLTRVVRPKGAADPPQGKV
jgi:hypothetical protein